MYDMMSVNQIKNKGMTYKSVYPHHYFISNVKLIYCAINTSEILFSFGDHI